MILLFHLQVSHSFYGYKSWEINKDSDKCFCQLTGTVDDCCCTIQDVDKLNTLYINSRIIDITNRNYFRYIKLHLRRKCPFWKEDFKCARKGCILDKCTVDELPDELKHDQCGPKGENKYSKQANSEEVDYPCSNKDKHLGHLNTTISDKQRKSFDKWNTYDSDDSFCVDLDEDSEEAEWIDLMLNPEQYTGYDGATAHRIWNSIYKENCFLPKKKIQSYDELNKRFLSKTCLEKRAFYRVVSGMHASINIHLSHKYPISKHLPTKPIMAPNPEVFHTRFHPDTTNNRGPYWLKNLYFIYSMTLRAVLKAMPYWRNLVFYTGNKKQDLELKQVILDLVNKAKTCPVTFDESQMFTGDPKKAQQLKEEFRNKFKNITRIMDCVECERCRVWGKLQTTGLATALKILFTSDKWDDVPVINGKKFSLTRTEIVSLFQCLCKFSNSLMYLNDFRTRMKKKK